MTVSGGGLSDAVIRWKPVTDAERKSRARVLDEKYEHARQLEKTDALGAGTHLPTWVRRNRDVYVIAEDLAPFLDGWASDELNRDDMRELSRRNGRSVSENFYLAILDYVHGLARNGVVGFCARPDQVGELVDVSERWAQHMNVRLDPQASWRREKALVARENAKRAKQKLPPLPKPKRPRGTCYVSRFSRRRKLDVLTRDLPYEYRRKYWRDVTGRLRTFVDLPGVTYINREGLQLLHRRAGRRALVYARIVANKVERRRTRLRMRKSRALRDLYRRLRPIFWSLRMRLKNGGREKFTPSSAARDLPTFVMPSEVAKLLATSADTGPPPGVDPPTSSAGPLGHAQSTADRVRSSGRVLARATATPTAAQRLG